jgi:lipopolysaccharide export system protein LptA
MKRILLILTALLVVTALSAADPISFSGGTTRMVGKEGQQRITLSDGAVVTTGSITLTAQTIELSGENFRYVTCTAAVTLTDVKRGITLHAANLFFDRSDELILITGYVEIDDKTNQVQGSAFMLSYEVERGLIELQVAVHLLRHTESGPMICKSDTLTFDRREQLFNLRGNATIDWDGDTYEAQRITVDLTTDEIEMKGSIKGIIHG